MQPKNSNNVFCVFKMSNEVSKSAENGSKRFQTNSRKKHQKSKTIPERFPNSSKNVPQKFPISSPNVPKQFPESSKQIKKTNKFQNS